MLSTWIPWRWIVRRIARSHGFLDPIYVWSQIRRFSQPSEVAVPIELLRSGAVMHARGLMNSRCIQHNLDWIWPYWVERQFDPNDKAFIPRAFSLTHINLSHRNWTAVGVPDYDVLPIVDPRGLLTPLEDGWSLDGWITADDGNTLLAPSQLQQAQQQLDFDGNLFIRTQAQQKGLTLTSEARVVLEEGKPVCLLQLEGKADRDAWLVASLRPYNPEGVQFVHHVELHNNRSGWTVDNKSDIFFNAPAERHRASEYHNGDVAFDLLEPDMDNTTRCRIGMASAAALYQVLPGQPRRIELRIPLPLPEEEGLSSLKPASMQPDRPDVTAEFTWNESLKPTPKLHVPDEQFQFIYDTAIKTLLLHSPRGNAYPGPYTYKRFWFRDSAFIVYALMCTGFLERAEKVIDKFPSRQLVTGYFHSQEGEWDSNGQALWAMQRWCELSGKPPKEKWLNSIRKGAKWIVNKRTDKNNGAPHAGLLPAGFSAEHLGPNDFYYWDDFWGVAGLQAAAWMLEQAGEKSEAEKLKHEAQDFLHTIERTLEAAGERLKTKAMPAAPSRRLDSGAVGSIAAGYPLMLWQPQDPRLMETAHVLLNEFGSHGGFFQDMIHSGINAYLSIEIAQVLMRGGDPRFFEVMKAIADLASPTGQWPEAVHPQTLGGCMGDGQHVWAASEWAVMQRNCFLYEDPVLEHLVLCAGIPQEWLDQGEAMEYGPAPTAFGKVTVHIDPGENEVQVSWKGKWHTKQPKIEVRLPGHKPVFPERNETSVTFFRETA